MVSGGRQTPGDWETSRNAISHTAGQDQTYLSSSRSDCAKKKDSPKKIYGNICYNNSYYCDLPVDMGDHVVVINTRHVLTLSLSPSLSHPPSLTLPLSPSLSPSLSHTLSVDMGDHVVVINTRNVVLTGNKWNQKLYRHHTGWVGTGTTLGGWVQAPHWVGGYRHHTGWVGTGTTLGGWVC